MDHRTIRPSPDDNTPDDDAINREDGAPETPRATEPPNPPHTTTGKITSPKFGSAASGGLELEPGPERD